MGNINYSTFKCLVIWFRRRTEENTLIVKYILYAWHRNTSHLPETGSQESCMAQKFANGMWHPSSLRSWVESRTCWKQLEMDSQYGQKFKPEVIWAPFIFSFPFLIRSIWNWWKWKIFSPSWCFFEAGHSPGLVPPSLVTSHHSQPMVALLGHSLVDLTQKLCPVPGHATSAQHLWAFLSPITRILKISTKTHTQKNNSYYFPCKIPTWLIEFLLKIPESILR